MQHKMSAITNTRYNVKNNADNSKQALWLADTSASYLKRSNHSREIWGNVSN